MESSKYLIAGGTTNWVEGLAQYYAKDEEKRRRYAEQLRQRDEQALKVQAAQSPIKMLEKLSSFSQTLGKLSQQQRNIAKQNAETEKSIAQVLLTKNIKPEEWAEVNRITRESVNNLKFEGALFKKNINASKLLSPAAKKTLTAQHGSSIYRIHEQIGFRSLRDLDAAIEAYGATDEGKAENFQVKLDEVRASGDHIAEKEIYKRFAFKQFNELGFNDEFIATNFSKPLDKFVGSKGVMSQLMYEKIHHTEQELDWDGRVDTAKELYDNGDKFALTNEFHSQLVESNNNKDRIVTHYYRLGKSGKLNRDELRALREGDLDEKLGFKAGDKGEALLSKEQWAQIERGISENEQATVKGYKTGISQQALTTIATIYKGEASIEELTAMRDETLLKMQRAGLTNTDAYKQLEGTDVSLQKPESYAAIRQDNSNYLEGSLQSHRLKDKENFKEEVKNGRVLDELNKKVAEDERYYRDVGLPIDHKGHIELANEKLKSSKGQKQRISGLSQVIEETEFKNLSKEIALKRQEFHILAREENQGNNVRANAQAEMNFERWLIDNGINEIDDGNNDNAGILSPTAEGIYRISKERRTAITERGTVGTLSNTTQWSQDLSTAHTESGGNKNRALKTANTFTSHADIQGVFLDGATEPYYSPEIIFKARALRIQPSQLILQQIQALQNGDHKDKDFYNRHNLKQYEEILKKAPDIQIEQALENFADKELLFLWRRGVEHMSGNQLTRLIDKLVEFKWQPDDKAAYSIP